MRLNKKSLLIISNERRLISCPFNVLFSHQQNEYVLSFPLLLAFSTKIFYLLWFSNFSFNNYWAKSLLSFVLATLQHVRLSLGNHFCTKVIPSSGAWMLAVINATSLVFSPCEWCGKRRNTDVCGSAGIIWLTKCTGCCSKEDFFQTCEAPCAMSPSAPLSVTSHCSHELFGFLFEAPPGLQYQISLSALGWWTAQVLACTPIIFSLQTNAVSWLMLE